MIEMPWILFSCCVIWLGIGLCTAVWMLQQRRLAKRLSRLERERYGEDQ
ncbi:MAG: hypothetical protein PUB69_02470 [Desulfovibrionaceae bacterium]|nr:hypothetical protein [Desulfovibrionaceae bacterium]